MNNACTPSTWRPLAARIIALFIAAIFILAAYPKLQDPAAFAEAIYRYQLLPDGAVNLLGIYLPWLEAVTAIALVAGRRFRHGALLAVALMLCVFIAAMGINLYRGVNIACGCFSVGGGSESMSWLNIARNLGLLLLAAITWRWSPPAGAPTNDPARPAG